jgi:hypothetical protein
MSTCSCSQYADISDRPSLNNRGHETKKIINSLILIATHSEKEHELYKCPTCGQFWQRSLDWIRGNKPYIFKVPNTLESEWTIKPYVQPDNLFNRIAVIEQYTGRASFEETAELCRKDGCSNQAIKLSVLCAFHHMESLGLKSKMTDEFTWFAPYLKNNYEFGIDQLKALPNYKSLSK